VSLHTIRALLLPSQGEAKLEMLRKMKEFKRGIHQLQWENRKCEMEVSAVVAVQPLCVQTVGVV
jgi:hypothetical protein